MLKLVVFKVIKMYFSPAITPKMCLALLNCIHLVNAFYAQQLEQHHARLSLYTQFTRIENRAYLSFYIFI